MIAYIEGSVLSSELGKIIVVSHGVGYEINYSKFLETGAQVKLFLHHHITDSDQSLWGFDQIRDKRMFVLLKTVNKVGSSKAYPLVTQLGVDTLMHAISLDEEKTLTAVKGIGKKMAEQIILSLKDKVHDLEGSFQPGLSVDTKETKHVDTHLFSETMAALESLGYKDKNLSALVRSQYEPHMSSSEDLLKQVLKEL